jgi:hypothetical protein
MQRCELYHGYAALSLMGHRGSSGATLDSAALKPSSKALSLSNMFASRVHV